jgi:Acyl-CoA carboxylase epsilon subunit
VEDRDDVQPARPLLRVVRGTPDEAELAALTAVVAGLAAAGGGEEEQPRRSLWSDHSDRMRRPMHEVAGFRGPGAWRASFLPR